uniref:Ig-like domain-containing protein n=1 Tax=Salmo trutta TaxID=8032 RepID=A0A674E022_SALTR
MEIPDFVSDVTKSSEISQPAPFLAAKLGDNVTVECHVTSNVDHMVWYKMTTGKELQCVAKAEIFYKHVHYLGNFRNGRFGVLIKVGIFPLNISSTKQEDIGMYYCGVLRLNFIEFGIGTALMLIVNLNGNAVVQQPVSESVQPGDSVTLNCTTHTETCVGEHSVYWFRHGSGESHPGIISTHGNRSDQCEKSPEAGSPTQNCVYNLPKRNLSLSDAGTYYCAVTSCREILFGKVTKLDIQEHDSPFDLSPTVLALVVSNIVLGIVTLLLVWALCKTLNRDSIGITLYLMYPMYVMLQLMCLMLHASLCNVHSLNIISYMTYSMVKQCFRHF